jgi:hypothetical protein
MASISWPGHYLRLLYSNKKVKNLWMKNLLLIRFTNYVCCWRKVWSIYHQAFLFQLNLFRNNIFFVSTQTFLRRNEFEFLNTTHWLLHYLTFQKLTKTTQCFREISYETQISTAKWPTDNYWVCYSSFNHCMCVCVNSKNLIILQGQNFWKEAEVRSF